MFTVEDEVVVVAVEVDIVVCAAVVEVVLAALADVATVLQTG